MTAEGATLIAHCLLEQLRHFKSTQLASYGLTSIPLVSACVTLSQGKYRGLSMRVQREAHGTCRQIEGFGDKSEPVIVIDDSISSGLSMKKAIETLEGEGYTVEGCIAIVDFPWRGGTETMRAGGYRMITLFDIWRDLGMRIDPFVEGYPAVRPMWDPDHLVEDGLSPADAARLVIEHYLTHDRVPQPPRCFDAPYQAEGGIFVSLRDKKNNLRIARNGFFIINPHSSDVFRDLVLAAYRTAFHAKQQLLKYGLENCKTGVSILSRQERILPKDLDFHRYGILVQSSVQPYKTRRGLAGHGYVPASETQSSCTMPVIPMRVLLRFEPFHLYRHLVVKSVQSGESWPAFGASALLRDTPAGHHPLPISGDGIIDYVRRMVGELSVGGDPVELPFCAVHVLRAFAVAGVDVSLYCGGLIGCWTAFAEPIGRMLYLATVKALNDWRYAEKEKGCALEGHQDRGVAVP